MRSGIYTELIITSDEIESARLNPSGEEFVKIFEVFFPKLTAFFVGKGLSPGEAEDLAQQTMLKVYKALPQFDSAGGKFDHWVFSIGYNLLRNEWRRSYAKVQLNSLSHESLEMLPIVDETLFSNPDEYISETTTKQEAARFLRKALEGLDPRQRAILFLHYWHDMSNKWLAEGFETTEGAIKQRLFRILKELRKQASLR